MADHPDQPRKKSKKMTHGIEDYQRLVVMTNTGTNTTTRPEAMEVDGGMPALSSRAVTCQHPSQPANAESSGGKEGHQRLFDLFAQARDITLDYLDPNTVNDPENINLNLRQLVEEAVKLTSSFPGTKLSAHKPTTFLSLPREIRDEIYTLVLVRTKSIKADHPTIRGLPRPNTFQKHTERMKNLGILRTCKQIKAEAEEIFYKRNTFKMRRSGGRLQVLNAEFHETGMSLRKFHDILSATPFDLIKRLEISLSSSDGPAESLWASCGRTRYFIRVPDETEEKYLDEVDPQFMTKYAQLCLTENDTLYDRGLRLFASWISMLDHIMTMPALRELIMNFEPIYRWGHYPIGPHDPIIPIDVPHADIEVLAMEALATRMRDRKKSTLGMITVTVDISAWCIMQGGVPIPMTVFLEKHKIWKHIGDDKYQASTMDCDLDYSPEPQWSCSSVKKAYGYWWPSTTQPYRIPIREFKHANLWIKSN